MTDPDWEFDHIDPSLQSHMHEVFTGLRERCPIVHSGKHGGFWVVLSHDLVREVASNSQAYTSTDGVTIPRVVGEIVLPPIDFDPPEHASYRKVIQKYFTRQAVAGYEGLLREVTRQRIVELTQSARPDLVPALATHIPAFAIAVILGLPPEDGEKFVSWAAQIFATIHAGDLVENQRVMHEFEDYLAQQIDRQRSDGRDTVITSITSGLFDGRPLTPKEQIGMIMLLVLAGHDTTVNSIGTMLYHLATVRGLRQLLIDDPGLVPKMVEECLRIESPVIVAARTVRHDTVLAGQPLTAGERIAFILNSANRDPAVFDRPDDFVCPRDRNPHVAFGYGVHRCVGEQLALLEMRIVAEEVLRLIPNYQLVDGYEPQWVKGRTTRGLTTLPVTL